MHRRVAASDNPDVPALLRILDVVDERPAVLHSGETRFSHRSDDGVRVARPVRGKGTEIGVRVTQEPCGYWDGDVTGESPVSEHALQECTTGAAIAVGERVNGLELRVCDRGLSEHRHVGATREGDDVSHQRWDTAVVGRHEQRGVRRDTPAAYPYLLVAPMTNVFRCRVAEQRILHSKDRALVEIVRHRNGSCHRADIRYDHACVAGSRFSDFGERNLFGARREILDLGTRRGLAPQQD